MLNLYERRNKDKDRLLVIVGTTASGKSALAIRIAKEFGGEIISADSWQVYRGFDIGTSKPSAQERKEIKHHLMDVTDAESGFNAPKFKELATAAIKDIQNRDKLPILAGGTGLYIDSVLYDFGFLPNLGPEARAELDAMSLDELLKLAKRSKISLSGVDKRNKRRVVRAIEAMGEKPMKQKLRAGTMVIGIKSSPDELRKRVEQRAERMLKDGLEQEVKDLSQRYGWEIEPMKGIGYKEWQGYFKGTRSLEDTKAKIIKNTLDLAKRQMTWFKRNPDIKWFSSPDKAYAFLTNF